MSHGQITGVRRQAGRSPCNSRRHAAGPVGSSQRFITSGMPMQLFRQPGGGSALTARGYSGLHHDIALTGVLRPTNRPCCIARNTAFFDRPSERTGQSIYDDVYSARLYFDL